MQLTKHFTKFIQKDFNWKVYLATLLFTGLIISLNYHFDFEDSILDANGQNWYSLTFYFFYYFIPYFTIIGFYWIFLPSFRNKLNKRFFFKSWYGIALLSIKVWFFYHLLLAPESGNYEVQYLFSKLSNRVVNVFIYIIGLLGFYKFLEIENKTYYGLTQREFNWMPFFVLLGLMVPLLLLASSQSDFLESYPRLSQKIVTHDYWKWFSIFEPFYLLEFVTLEWFFRGFLVIGMVRLIGHRAVLPMAVLYCLFHFGKPMGECISSLFGGYILGVVAYYTRSVWGGIVVHMGIALLMDIFAIIAHSIS